MEGQTQNSVNLEIPSRWRRFSAYLLDLIINWVIVMICIPFWILGPWIIIIRIIANLVGVFSEKTTLWNMIVWINAIKENNNSINTKQVFFRYFIFYSTLINVALCVWLSAGLIFYLPATSCPVDPSQYNDFCRTKYIVWVITGNFFIICSVIPCTINLVELFFKCPTFIDKRLWIKRFYKKSK